jgi:hypothetical protein
MSEAIAWLNERGFEPSGFFPLVRHHDGLRVVEFDGVFLPNR